MSKLYLFKIIIMDHWTEHYREEENNVFLKSYVLYSRFFLKKSVRFVNLVFDI